jgi:hypothetical protein
LHDLDPPCPVRTDPKENRPGGRLEKWRPAGGKERAAIYRNAPVHFRRLVTRRAGPREARTINLTNPRANRPVPQPVLTLA